MRQRLYPIALLRDYAKANIAVISIYIRASQINQTISILRKILKHSRFVNKHTSGRVFIHVPVK